MTEGPDSGSYLLLSDEGKRSNDPQVPLGHGVVGLHGPQPSVVKHGHEETLGEVVEVLPEGQHVEAFPPGGRVHSASLHPRAERADRGALRGLGLKPK